MPDEREFEALKGRIVELENQLKAGAVKREVTDLSAEDLKAYAKVRDVIAADWGETCGINECYRCISRCTVCTVCTVCTICTVCTVCVGRCIQVCINECTCGPCNVGGLGNVGDLGGRFGGLGH